VRGTSIGPAKKVRDVFSACLRIDVPQVAKASTTDGHIKLVMCFVEVCSANVAFYDDDSHSVQKHGTLDCRAEMGHGL
jgi:hypothetical protein